MGKWDEPEWHDLLVEKKFYPEVSVFSAVKQDFMLVQAESRSKFGAWEKKRSLTKV